MMGDAERARDHARGWAEMALAIRRPHEPRAIDKAIRLLRDLYHWADANNVDILDAEVRAFNAYKQDLANIGAEILEREKKGPKSCC